MGFDISTMWTRESNKKNGRRGYLGWKDERDTIISPKNYGGYILEHHRKGGR